jgi:hypothetical protein
MSLSTIFHFGDKFYRWRKLEYPKKTTNLLLVTDELYYIMLYPVVGFELTTNRAVNFAYLLCPKMPQSATIKHSISYLIEITHFRNKNLRLVIRIKKK